MKRSIIFFIAILLSLLNSIAQNFWQQIPYTRWRASLTRATVSSSPDETNYFYKKTSPWCVQKLKYGINN
jgi:ABC-type uncharacterized transport system fused permease/ATPase subunit